MLGINDIVITGMGCVSPLGIGCEALYANLLAGRCAIAPYITLSDAAQTTFYAAQIEEFDAKQFVTPRKALKVMGREVQVAYSAAHLAWDAAGLRDFTPDPERTGVVFGSEIIPGDIADLQPAIASCAVDGRMDFASWGPSFAKHIYPLWMLKYLPNMAACHIGIAVDARGPNNSLAMEEASGLLALEEAAAIIRRGDADVMIVGACGARVTPTRMLYRAPERYMLRTGSSAADQPPFARPFDARREGIVPGEGAAAIVLERRSHAVRRRAPILAEVTGFSSRFGRPPVANVGSQAAVAAAASDALQQAGVAAGDLAHVSAQGYSQPQADIQEARAIAAVAPQAPVTAFSSYFGTAGAACGLMELIASIQAVRAGQTLPTLGYHTADPECPIDVCRRLQPTTAEHILKLSFTLQGQAAAVVVQCVK